MTSTSTAVSPKSFDEAQKRMRETGEEFCVLCYTFLGFPARVHVESSIRNTCGARYVEGAGQVCKKCSDSQDRTSGHSEH